MVRVVWKWNQLAAELAVHIAKYVEGPLCGVFLHTVRPSLFAAIRVTWILYAQRTTSSLFMLTKFPLTVTVK